MNWPIIITIGIVVLALFGIVTLAARSEPMPPGYLYRSLAYDR
jgi:hypothetical protein